LRTPRSANPNDTRLAVLLAKVDAVLRFANNPLGTFGELRAARAAFDEVPGGETGNQQPYTSASNTNGPARGETGEGPTIIPE
jgi:hypothetical protein